MMFSMRQIANAFQLQMNRSHWVVILVLICLSFDMEIIFDLISRRVYGGNKMKSQCWTIDLHVRTHWRHINFMKQFLSQAVTEAIDTKSINRELIRLKILRIVYTGFINPVTCMISFARRRRYALSLKWNVREYGGLMNMHAFRMKRMLMSPKDDSMNAVWRNRRRNHMFGYGFFFLSVKQVALIIILCKSDERKMSFLFGVSTELKIQTEGRA